MGHPGHGVSHGGARRTPLGGPTLGSTDPKPFEFVASASFPEMAVLPRGRRGPPAP